MSELSIPKSPRPENNDLKKYEEERYFPPGKRILDMLGVTEHDLARGKVQVDGSGLRRLISKYAETLKFDADWYAETNPDVESARLAGDIPSLREHFVVTGYLEGRLPHKLPFDPNWYRRHYKDICAQFSATDVNGMQDHYLSSGYFEGRVGTENALPEADFWWYATAR